MKPSVFFGAIGLITTTLAIPLDLSKLRPRDEPQSPQFPQPNTQQPHDAQPPASQPNSQPPPSQAEDQPASLNPNTRPGPPGVHSKIPVKNPAPGPAQARDVKPIPAPPLSPELTQGLRDKGGHLHRGDIAPSTNPVNRVAVKPVNRLSMDQKMADDRGSLENKRDGSAGKRSVEVEQAAEREADVKPLDAPPTNFIPKNPNVQIGEGLEAVGIHLHRGDIAPASRPANKHSVTPENGLPVHSNDANKENRDSVEKRSVEVEQEGAWEGDTTTPVLVKDTYGEDLPPERPVLKSHPPPPERPVLKIHPRSPNLPPNYNGQPPPPPGSTYHLLPQGGWCYGPPPSDNKYILTSPPPNCVYAPPPPPPYNEKDYNKKHDDKKDYDKKDYDKKDHDKDDKKDYDKKDYSKDNKYDYTKNNQKDYNHNAYNQKDYQKDYQKDNSKYNQKDYNQKDHNQNTYSPPPPPTYNYPPSQPYHPSQPYPPSQPYQPQPYQRTKADKAKDIQAAADAKGIDFHTEAQIEAAPIAANAYRNGKDFHQEAVDEWNLANGKGRKGW